jgi:hypothetical protein
MSDLQGVKSANVRQCFAIRATVIDTECPMGWALNGLRSGRMMIRNANAAVEAGTREFDS